MISGNYVKGIYYQVDCVSFKIVKSELDFYVIVREVDYPNYSKTNVYIGTYDECASQLESIVNRIESAMFL